MTQYAVIQLQVKLDIIDQASYASLFEPIYNFGFCRVNVVGCRDVLAQ